MNKRKYKIDNKLKKILIKKDKIKIKSKDLLKKITHVSFLATTMALIVSCSNEVQELNYQVPFKEEVKLGINNVMPTIGNIYIDNVTVGEDDGNIDEMTKAHLKYSLSADIITDNYGLIDGNGRCEWKIMDSNATFIHETEDRNNKNNIKYSQIFYNDKTKNFECVPVLITYKTNQDNKELKSNTSNHKFDMNSVVRLKFIDKKNDYLKFINSAEDYYTYKVLNTADRHNVRNIIASPTTTMFHRADGLFQSGYTVYRGIKSLNKFIGSAMYEDNIKTPGLSYPNELENYSDRKFYDDTQRINNWVKNNVNENNLSSSVFVSSYGAPIALPPYKEDNNINYSKIRHLSLVNNNNPIIITNDKKAYTMGIYTRFNSEELNTKYKSFIKENNNWFQYSGVNTQKNSYNNSLHVGEITTSTGLIPRFVLGLETSPQISSGYLLNETDREYYIIGNPNYNVGTCYEISKLNKYNNTFDFNHSCTEDRKPNIGAVKIPGLQEIIGDGRTAYGTDLGIYFKGLDDLIYFIDLSVDSPNYKSILKGEKVTYAPINIEVSEFKKEEFVIKETTENEEQDKEDKINYLDRSYKVIDFKTSNNSKIEPTFLLNDGSIVFTVRKVIDNNGDYKIQFFRKHLYINRDGTIHHEKGHLGNIKIKKLIGPNLGYGENGKLYSFTDILPLGVSYQPLENNLRDNDYIAYIESDPVSLIKLMKNKKEIFEIRYGEVNIEKAIKTINDKNVESSDSNLIYEDDDKSYNKYVVIPYVTNNEYNLITSKNEEDETHKPFQNNTLMFVDISSKATYNYIHLPFYFYGFDSSSRTDRRSWIEKENGLMAGEIRHKNVSKVYGTDYEMFYKLGKQNYKNNIDLNKNNEIKALKSLPFKTVSNLTSTVFFGNKVGIFSFVNYNTRKYKDLCQDVSVNKFGHTYDRTTKGCNIKGIEMFNEHTPDFFYRGKSNKISVDSLNNKVINQTSDAYKILEEANGKNNNTSNLFVNEGRIANFPNNEKYLYEGFEPQLLSSYVLDDTINYPGQVKYNEFGDDSIHPHSNLKYLIKTIVNYSGVYLKENEIFQDFYKYTTPGVNNIGKENDSVGYMSGLLRDYEVNTFPVWRSKKLSKEILQLQSRYATLIPLTHGNAFNYLLKVSDKLYNLSPYIVDNLEESDENVLSMKAEYDNNMGSLSEEEAKELYAKYNKIALDNKEFLKPRSYGTHLYSMYDKFSLENEKSIDDVSLGNINLEFKNISNHIDTYKEVGSGIGYIMVKGNYMWRGTTLAAKTNGMAVSSSNPLNKHEYFKDFIVYHSEDYSNGSNNDKPESEDNMEDNKTESNKKDLFIK